MRIAVLGASGYIGGRLVPALLEDGHEVTCLARTPDRLTTRPWFDDVEIRRADALDAASVQAGLRGCDVAYHLVHSMGHQSDFADADRTAAANVRDGAATEGLRHVVYLGGLGDDADPDLSPHLGSRHEVGEVLAAGPTPTTELRAAIILGSGSASFEMLRSLVETLPVMVTPRWVTEVRCQPVAISDIIRDLVGVLDHPPSNHRVLDVGGPDVVTYRELMDLYADVAGLRRRFILPVPVLTPLLSSHWVNLVTALPIDLARPLIESQVNDVLVRPEHDIRQLLPREPLTTAEAIRRALERVQGLELPTSWVDAGPARPAQPYPGDPHWAGGTLLTDERTVRTSRPRDDVFAEVTAVGGKNGWFTADWAWRLRGLIDKLFGGPGMRRGRRHPTELATGDAVDFFRVEVLDEASGLLRLRAEMLVPGEAWLEWRVEPDGAGTRIDQRALFHPKGLSGRLYWSALVPAHAIIFRRMLHALATGRDGAGTVVSMPAQST